MSPSDTVEHFLATGQYDPLFAGWKGGAAERHQQGVAALRDILVRIVNWRMRRAPLRSQQVPVDAALQIRSRITPMISGLFEEEVASQLLESLPHQVQVVSAQNFASVIASVPLGTAWDLANLVLDDMGALPLADDTPELDGLCVNGVAWVLGRAFSPAGPFSDVIVHEVGHLLHTMRPALLAVPPMRRETFAYACEIWSCILRGFSDTQAGVAAFQASAPPVDARVDQRQLDRLLSAAALHPEGAWRGLRVWATRGKNP